MTLTNKEIKVICINEQDRQTSDTYPEYKFKITQNADDVKIYWEYLDGKCWTIDKDTLIAVDDHLDIMNMSFDYDSTLEEVIRSCVYYMVTRY